MCGIAGAAGDRPGALRALVERMSTVLAHRGPDDFGIEGVSGVCLGHRRLTVIDLSPNGHQPMSNEDGTVWITYNGEVYDTSSTRQWLESKGHRFRSTTDTEVIVHLYEELGTGLFSRINGMFAFAIHDRKRHRLLLARDRLGIKPLYYTIKDRCLYFASELKAIIAGLGERPSLRPEALGQYLLQGFASAPDTIYDGVHLLPPGHWLEVDLGQLSNGQTFEPVEYWDAAFTGDDDRPVEVLEAKLEELLADAVRIRMVADVPFGAFLSGGIDSSLVVAMMAQFSNSPIRTFSVDVPGTDRSEGVKARAVAAKWQTAHLQVDATDTDAEAYWDRLEHFDAPFNCPSLLNAWIVSTVARKHVTVALSGDGGDELFAGYTRYQALTQPIPRRFAGGLFHFAGRLLPFDQRGRSRLLEQGRDAFFQSLTARHPIPIDAAEALCGASLREWVDKMRAIYDRHQADRLTRGLYFDLKTYLADHILAKVDSASMAVSLEVRVPMLDYRIVELAGRIPASLKIRDGSAKWLLKRIARRLLPEGLVDQKKVGFDPPLSSWLFDAKQQHCLEVLTDPAARYRTLLDGRLVDRWSSQMRRGSRWRVPQRACLWAIYQLEQWLRQRERAMPLVEEPRKSKAVAL